MKFNREHKRRIQGIFEEKTGAVLRSGRKTSAQNPLCRRFALVLALVLVCCFTTGGLAVSRFSSLEEDDLALAAVYEGDGIVQITVQNRSDKNLNFEEQLKVMQWNSSKEVEPKEDGDVIFLGTSIPAGETGTMTINLSLAYDMQLLETPLEKGDHYYLVLTNNGFLLGQDWHCSVDFGTNRPAGEDAAAGSDTSGTSGSDELSGSVRAETKIDPAVLQRIPEQLRFYFETDSFGTENRSRSAGEYMEAVSLYLRPYGDRVLMPVTPYDPRLIVNTDNSEQVTFDERVDADRQYLLAGEHLYSVDAWFKMIGRYPMEEALTLEAYIPDGWGDLNDGFIGVPLLYIVTYETSAIREDSLAFLYGQLLDFTEMEEYKIYEDDRYACYEISPLLYTDAAEYARTWLEATGQDGTYDEAAEQRLLNIYNYYKENAGRLMEYVE